MNSSSWKKTAPILGAVLLIGLGILLNIHSLVVSYPGEDETGYLADGANLIEKGVVPAIGSGSLPALVNGVLDLPFRGDHSRLGLVSTFRRFLCFSIILFAAWMAARALGGTAAGWIALGLVAIGRPISVVLNNSADSLYTAFSALSFALLVLFFRKKQDGKGFSLSLLLGSAASLAIAALARLDGLLLGCAILLCLLALLWKEVGGRRSVFAYLAIFAGIVGGWMLLAGLLRGNWDPQISQRSYLAFVQGHNFLYTDRYEVPPAITSESLYGTAEENGYSVLRAILRNPSAFLARLPLAAANAYRMFSNAYSIIGGDFFLILVLAGFISLWGIWKRTVMVLLLWPIPLLGYLMASFRPGFFGTIFPQMVAVVAAMIPVVLADIASRWREGAVKPLLIIGACVLGVFVAANVAYGAQQSAAWWKSDKGASYGEWERVLAANIPAGSCVLAFNQTDPLYANLVGDTNWMAFYQVKTQPELTEYLQQTGCRWVIVDPNLIAFAPEFARLVEGGMLPAFDSPDGTRRVYTLASE